MKIEYAIEIISSLSSIYPLTDIEEEAIKTIVTPKELVKAYKEWDSYIYACPNCKSLFADGNFCSKCGQPLAYNEE